MVNLTFIWYVISDSAILNCNRLVIEKNNFESAKKIWELGKEIGITYGGNENELIAKLVEMETRDKASLLPGGVNGGC